MNTAWKRWQDYATIIFGVALFATPLVFGDISQATATTTAYILGVVLVLAGLLAAAMREANQVEWIPVILGVITFISPFVLGFTAVTAVAWAAYIIGVLAVVNAGSLLLNVTGNRRPNLA
ncbi:MAG TPA: SPW repeat protein [Candidatus Angelobacter sp.]|nr:SPW repeat protein [Candidatus Angelobacter sp.]